MRLANQWYAATPSPRTASAPPFGTLDDAQLEYASSHSPLAAHRRQSPVARRESPQTTTTAAATAQPHYVSSRKYAYDILGVGGVARDLGFDERPLPALAAENLDNAASRRMAEALRAERATALSPSRVREQEREQVRETLAEAAARLEREEAERQAKMDEQMRFLQESERQLLARIERERALERVEEERARAYLHQLDERKRRQAEAAQQLCALREARAARVAAAWDRDGDFASSALREAARRVLQAHKDDLDRVEPVLKEIMREPEFALPATLGPDWHKTDGF